MRLRTLLMAVLAPSLLTAATAPGNHPTGTAGVFMVDKLGAHLRFFDPVTLAERSNLKLPANPHDFAFSADHRRAYVPIYGPGIYKRNPKPITSCTSSTSEDVRSHASSTSAVQGSAHGVQVAPDGSLYVTAELDRKILHVDPERAASSPPSTWRGRATGWPSCPTEARCTSPTRTTARSSA